MLNRFKHTMDNLRGLINEETWSAPSGKMLLAVSGGMDSMCLADIVLKVYGAESFAMAHCNFHLRGEESDGDQALVAGWAQEHGILLHCIDFETEAYAASNGISIEMAARELRYGWFDRLCKEHGYSALVVAHHADDNAETLVLNMLRGAGLKGMSGMKELSSLPYGSAPLLRPLLRFTRKQIEGHVFANKVPYRNDSTNASVEYRRNSIRHEVFPVFEKMNPSYVRTLNREMGYMSDAESIVSQWCREKAAKACMYDRDGCRINIADLMSVPQWRSVLYFILDPFGFNQSVLESIESLLESDRTVSGKSFASKEYVLNTERGDLVVKKVLPGVEVNSFEVVRCAGTYNVCGRRVLVEETEWTPGMQVKQPEGTVIMDASVLKFPFVLRGWRNGDWMIPLGMRGKKKLSDLFTDLKYERCEKDSAVIAVDCTAGMADEQHVAAVAGVRVDDRYKVTDATGQIIKISIIG